MTTPYTLIRGRMKHLISCFNACKVPIEDDADESDNRKAKPSIRDDRNRKREKKVKDETTPDRGGGEESPASWQSCQSEEDDYIVFYFKDDEAGGGDVIEERGLDAGCYNRRNKESTSKSHVARRNEPETEPEPEPEQHRHTCSESSESSTGSFAFPAMQREWPGSPVLMPRPEVHNKPCGVCMQCCKFRHHN